jgi:hypothetical protein
MGGIAMDLACSLGSQFYTCAYSVALHAHKTVSPEQNNSHPGTSTLLHVIWEE